MEPQSEFNWTKIAESVGNQLGLMKVYIDLEKGIRLEERPGGWFYEYYPLRHGPFKVLDIRLHASKGAAEAALREAMARFK